MIRFQLIVNYPVMCLTLFLVIVLSAYAQEITWERIDGFEDSIIGDLAATPDGAIYVLPEKGDVFRLKKDENTWTPLKAGLMDAFVTDLMVTPEGNLYAAGESGVFSLKGDMWVSAGLGVWKLAVSGKTLYAISVGDVYRLDNDGLWVRTHFADWDFPDIRQMLEHIGASSTIVCASHFGGHASKCQQCSRDGGKTWERTDCLPVLCFSALNESLYMGADYEDELFWPGGVYKLNQSQLKWEYIGLGKLDVWALEFARNMMYAGTEGHGVFRSDDKGNTWVNIGLADDDVTVYALSVAESVLYAGTNRGLFCTALQDDPTLMYQSGKCAVSWGCIKYAP